MILDPSFVILDPSCAILDPSCVILDPSCVILLLHVQLERREFPLLLGPSPVQESRSRAFPAVRRLCGSSVGTRMGSGWWESAVGRIGSS